MRVIINSIEELPALASKITKAYSNRVIAFYGDMSVGKTTFIKYLCQELGVDPSFVNSPTYAIVNEYETLGDQLVFHFDFYRIESDIEALDIGFEDYLDSGAWNLIEWPQKVGKLLSDDHQKVHLQVVSENRRVLKLC